jgi:hypothetical protein
MGAIASLITILLGAQAPARSNDFALRLTTSCPYERIDTFNGTYTRHTVGLEVMIPLILSEEQHKALVDVVVESRWFEVGMDLTRPDVRPGVRGGIISAPTVELEVQRAGETRRLGWSDMGPPRAPDYGRVKDLIAGILRVVRSHPAVQKIGPLADGCM